MSSQTRWIVLLVTAFVVTLAGLRFLNREQPIIAFSSKATIAYQDFWALPFDTKEATNLVIEVNSKSGIDYTVVGVSSEDHAYFMKVNRGEIPRERNVTYFWKSDADTRHRSPPVPIERGSYILHIENSLTSNTKQLPVAVTVRAVERPIKK